MVTTIKQTVTVQAGGRVAVQSPELREGETAEVVVVVERDATSIQDRLDALRRLTEEMRLTPEAAAKWEADIRAEREAWRAPREQ